MFFLWPSLFMQASKRSSGLLMEPEPLAMFSPEACRSQPKPAKRTCSLTQDGETGLFARFAVSYLLGYWFEDLSGLFG